MICNDDQAQSAEKSKAWESPRNPICSPAGNKEFALGAGRHFLKLIELDLGEKKTVVFAA